MKFGSLVTVTRGSPLRAPGSIGCERKVRGVLVGARGNDRMVRLTQDDPLSACDYCPKRGDVGWWSASAVTPRIEPRRTRAPRHG